MNEINVDNGGRRSGIDRRQFSYSGYLPERRNGEDRRSGEDRRAIRKDRRKRPLGGDDILEMRSGADRRAGRNLII